MINLLQSVTNQQSRFRRKKCFEINFGTRGNCNPNDQINIKTKTLKPSLLLWKEQK